MTRPERRRTSTSWKSAHLRGTLAELLATLPAPMRSAHTPQHLAVRADLFALIQLDEIGRNPIIPPPLAQKMDVIQLISRHSNEDVIYLLRVSYGFLVGRGMPVTLDRVAPIGAANVPLDQQEAWLNQLREAAHRLSEARHDQDFDFLLAHAGFGAPEEAQAACEAMRQLARMTWLRLRNDAQAVKYALKHFPPVNERN